MKRKIMDYMDSTHMLERGDRLVLGVSGGADSVCLLRILTELRPVFGLQLFAVHINHGIRGEEAMRDQRFTEQLCQELAVPCTTVAVDVPGIAAQQGMSEEEAGRKLRYQEFIRAAERLSCKKIAVAHHMDDNAETVLFRIFRGTGLLGLSGIRPVGPCPEQQTGQELLVIRPLLCVTRTEIEQYLNEQGQAYCEDSTNRSSDYARNVVRNQILPLAEERLNQGAVANINALAERACAVEQYLEEQAESEYCQLVKETTGQNLEFRLLRGITGLNPVLAELVVRNAVIRAAGHRKDITSAHIASVLALFRKQVGSRLNLPYGLIAVCEYDGVVLQKGTAEKEPEEAVEYFQLPFSGEEELQQMVRLPEQQGVLTLSICRQPEGNPVNSEKNMINSKNSYTKCFDYDKIKNTVSVRTVSPGDFITINPSGGTKRLKDYFSDIKLPRTERSRQIVIAAGHQILWVLGGRTGENYRVLPLTKTILQVTWTPAEK